MCWPFPTRLGCNCDMTPASVVVRILVPVTVIALSMTACSSSTGTSSSSVPPSASAQQVMASADAMESDGAMASSTADDASKSGPGAYIALAEYEGSKDMYANGDVVLFFHAGWCPTCREADENLNADPAAIPAGLTIVKVDYDDSDELKQKYGVTTQHTFVQVDADGNELGKWTGSVTAADIAGHTA